MKNCIWELEKEYNAEELTCFFFYADADTIPNYENVIRNIHYYHNKPENLANRTLTLYCSSQNQRFTSTKFIERVSPSINCAFKFSVHSFSYSKITFLILKTMQVFKFMCILSLICSSLSKRGLLNQPGSFTDFKSLL